MELSKLIDDDSDCDHRHLVGPSRVENHWKYGYCDDCNREVVIELDNSEYDKTGNEIAAAMKGRLTPLTQGHFSHYNSKANRCFVELRVTPNLLVLTASKESSTFMKRDEFWKRFEADYVQRTLYDGQTGEELAYVQKGLTNHLSMGFLKGEKVDWSKAYSEIDRMMADH